MAILEAIIQTIEHFAEEPVNAERRTAEQATVNLMDINKKRDFELSFSGKRDFYNID